MTQDIHQNTDGQSIDIIAQALKDCCDSWNPEARIVGNIRAEDIARLCKHVIRDQKIESITK